jgi:Ca-activated chloride channel homolog
LELKFDAAVAGFGMILRESEYKGRRFVRRGRRMGASKGADENGYRDGFLMFVRKTQELKARM